MFKCVCFPSQKVALKIAVIGPQAFSKCYFGILEHFKISPNFKKIQSKDYDQRVFNCASQIISFCFEKKNHELELKYKQRAIYKVGRRLEMRRWHHGKEVSSFSSQHHLPKMTCI